jgi:hypothetical protein
MSFPERKSPRNLAREKRERETERESRGEKEISANFFWRGKVSPEKSQKFRKSICSRPQYVIDFSEEKSQ